jgi:hypothetical protein
MFGEFPDQFLESSDPKQNEPAEKISPNKDLEPMSHQIEGQDFGQFGQFEEVEEQDGEKQEGFGDFGEFDEAQ